MDAHSFAHESAVAASAASSSAAANAAHAAHFSQLSSAHHHQYPGTYVSELDLLKLKYKRKIESLYEEASAGSVYVLHKQGEDGMCCWPGWSITCDYNRNHYLPRALEGIMAFEDFSDMVMEMDQALEDSHLCMFFCSSGRSVRVDSVLEQYNKRVEGDYFWVSSPTLELDAPCTGIAFLKRLNVTSKSSTSQSKKTEMVAIATTASAPCEDTVYDGYISQELPVAQYIPADECEIGVK